MKSNVSRTRHLLIQSVQYLLLISYAFTIVDAVNQEVDGHLSRAKRLLSSGKYNDALPHLHAAIEADPNNYLTIFRRATVFLALNRPKPALEDLNRAIELKPDFVSALFQRGNLLVKLGRLDEAHINFEAVLRHDPNHDEATTMYQKVEKLKEDLLTVEELIEEDRYGEALHTLETIIESIPWSIELLKERAKAFEKVGDTRRAINDYLTMAKLATDVTIYLTIAKLSYSLGDISESLSHVRECLKLDPDNQACMKHYKPTKKLNNHVTSMMDSLSGKKYDNCFAQGENALEIVMIEHPRFRYSISSVMCRCMSKAGDTLKGLKMCKKALEDAPEGGGIEDMAIPEDELLCDYADLLIEEEDYASALKYYQKSYNLKQSRRAQLGMEKAKRVQKQRKKRNYYKILGVPRNADEADIGKAYRKLAAKWHPDRHHDKEAKKIAQAKFMDIADAKAVLTDPEKRQLYDRELRQLVKEVNCVGREFNRGNIGSLSRYAKNCIDQYQSFSDLDLILDIKDVDTCHPVYIDKLAAYHQTHIEGQNKIIKPVFRLFATQIAHTCKLRLVPNIQKAFSKFSKEDYKIVIPWIDDFENYKLMIPMKQVEELELTHYHRRSRRRKYTKQSSQRIEEGRT
ncbi:DnaJ-like subfamily C member 3 [Fragariocoptes setiger]|uniref:DnaJ-like subfamily C member 3 n=1 Tax=Fragariocoptes setiger TaxID=1670756 RepID=A0ABQ7SAH4_9ACAR|nr:DnaJ-like subfamily C member 3 [Fragariocoptes setiger]